MPASSSVLKELRHDLHRNAERSRAEELTAKIVSGFLKSHTPDNLVENLGGHGLAAVYEGRSPGPTVLLRSELDALPIRETIDSDHGSVSDGVSHKCGHDGHMTIVAGLAPLLADSKPSQGRVVLLFQPAEETGEGARLVIDDPKFARIKPDRVFALHNLPGFPLGSVISKRSCFASASRGMIVSLGGATSHAAEPHKGRSPALAAAQIIQALSAAVQFHTALHEGAKVTVISARVGERAFGTSPGYGEVMATVRAHTDDVMERLCKRCEGLARDIAHAFELDEEVSWTEEFVATINDDQSVDLVEKAADELGVAVVRPEHPFAWSEDFGHFTALAPGALFGLGAGADHPALHRPEYDFPDELIDVGINLFRKILKELLGGA